MANMTSNDRFSSPSGRLEQYTIKRPQEVLLVQVIVEEQEDEIMIFKGFSSSLMRPTAFDPDVPVLPDGAEIVSFARLQAPHNLTSPQYIPQDLTWEAMQPLLGQVGV